MRITVLVPTYNRTESLRRCLEALSAQTRPPDQVVLVIREDDIATLQSVADWMRRLPLMVVRPQADGQVNALNAGLGAAEGDIVAITDDDAAPRPDWLQRIEMHFERDPVLGGVGGRDWVHHGSMTIDGAASLVGKVQWFGRLAGNHHLGVGPAREVDFLKGANMSYRRKAINGLVFDQQLQGRGAQVCNDLAFSLAIRNSGWKLIYDPSVAVDHYPAPRFDLDQRGHFSAKATEDSACNQYWALLSAMKPGFRQDAACGWQRLVGSRGLPGLLHLMLGLWRRDKLIWQRWNSAHRGRQIAREKKRTSEKLPASKSKV